MEQVSPTSYAPITFLTLSGCDSLTDKGLCLVSKYFGGSLETLNVSSCKLLTGKSLRPLSRSAQSLVSLDLGSTRTKPAHILCLLKRCRKLRSLNVGGCEGVDRVWIEGIMGRDFHDCKIWQRGVGR